MIARLSGLLVERGADSLIIDVNGVGYRVAVSKLTADELPPEGEPLTVQIHTHVREDAISLFGFVDRAERDAFEALIGMTGMGPKAAISVLSGIDARELARAVVGEDLARLCLIPGIGKKKAERMVLELKDRMLPLAQAPEGEPVGGSLDDLRSALTNLGYKPTEADRAVAALRKKALSGDDLDALLPEALRLLRG